MQPIFRELLILMIVVWEVAVVLRRIGAPKQSIDRSAKQPSRNFRSWRRLFFAIINRQEEHVILIGYRHMAGATEFDIVGA